MFRALAGVFALLAMAPAVYAQPHLPGSAPGPPPGAGPPPTGVELSISLVGEWSGEGGIEGAYPPVRLVDIVKADGTFIEWTTYANGFTFEEWGRFIVEATSPTSGYITVTPIGWTPKVACSAGRWPTCTPLNPQPETDTLSVIDQNTILLSQGLFKVRLVRRIQ